MLIMGAPSRFWARVVIDDTGYETACLTWTGSKTGAGYGNLKISGRNVYAHRLVFEARHGVLPERVNGDRAVIDHLCRNRACVNVDHMELVTNRINILRGETLQAANAAKTHCINGHEFTADNTYRKPNGKRECRACNRNRRSR